MSCAEILRSVALFVVAAIAEIGGAWLVWQSVREGRGWALVLLGGLALFVYGFVATFQTDPHFGPILAAYGGCSSPARSPGAWRSTASDPTATT